MANIDTPFYTSGVSEESHEVIWKVRSYNTVVSTPELVGFPKLNFSVTVQSGIKFNWQTGFKILTDDKFAMYLKLQSILPSSIPHVFVKWSLESSKTGEEGTWNSHPDRTISVPTRISPDKELLLRRDTWIMGKRFSVDAEGSHCWKITLILILPIDTLPSSLCEEALAKLKSQAVNRLQEDLASLNATSDSTDLEIHCSDEGSVLSAHKLILAARNSVFAAMFASETSENQTGILRVDDISSSTMNIVLHYIYIGKLLKGWKDSDTILEFTYAAGKYQLTEVLEMLDNLLGTDEISVCNMTLLGLATKLFLRNAEQRMMERLIKEANQTKSGENFVALFGGNQ